MNRKLLIILLAALVAGSTVAPGELPEGSRVLDILRQLGRPVTYGLLLVLFTCSLLFLVTSRQGAKPGIVTSSYAALFVLMATKFVVFGFSENAIQFFLAALLYLTVFGFYLPTLRRSFDITAAVTTIGLANLILLLMNAPTIPFEGSHSITGRLSGLAFNPNILAYSLALSSTCLFAITRHIRPSHTGFILQVSALAVSTVLVTMTLSRGALVLMFASIFVNLYFMTGRYRKIFGLSIPIFTLSAFYYLVNSPVYQLVFVGRFDTRSHIFQRQLDSFFSNPFFGDAWLEARVVYGENAFLGAGAELGVIGLVLVSLISFPLLVVSVRQGWFLGRTENSYEYKLASAFLFLTLASSSIESMLLGVVGPIIFAVLIVDAAIVASGGARFRLRKGNLQLRQNSKRGILRDR